MTTTKLLGIKIIACCLFIGAFLGASYSFSARQLQGDSILLARSFSAAVDILASGISAGYFRWDETRTAVQTNDAETIAWVFTEAERCFSPWLKELELVEAEIAAPFYESRYESGRFSIYFAIFDSHDLNRLRNRLVRASIDHARLLATLSDNPRLAFGNMGQPFAFGLAVRSRPALLNLAGAFILLLGCLAINLLLDYIHAKQLKISSLNNKLEKLLQVSLLLSIKENKSIEQFLTQFFRIVFSFIPEADFGSVLILKNDEWHFLDALGHDINLLGELHLKKDDIASVDKVTVLRKLQEHTEKTLDKANLEIFRQAVRKVKETLVIPLCTEKKFYGTLSLDIAEKSPRVFQPESVELMAAFSNLVTSYFVLNEFSENDRAFQNNLLLSMIHLLEIHDPYTKGHAERVANMARAMAARLGHDGHELLRMYWSGLVHDIGKIVISYDILNKPQLLQPLEYDEIKLHPLYGHDVLTKSENLKDIAYIVLCHHERFDGKGYPQGLKGEEIPPFARIIAVVDAFDSMTSGRSYRKASSPAAAVAEIVKHSGSQFDPQMTDLFQACLAAGDF